MTTRHINWEVKTRLTQRTDRRNPVGMETLALEVLGMWWGVDNRKHSETKTTLGFIRDLYVSGFIEALGNQDPFRFYQRLVCFWFHRIKHSETKTTLGFIRDLYVSGFIEALGNQDPFRFYQRLVCFWFHRIKHSETKTTLGFIRDLYVSGFIEALGNQCPFSFYQRLVCFWFHRSTRKPRPL